MREKKIHRTICLMICTFAIIFGMVFGPYNLCYAKEGEGGVGVSVSYEKLENDKFPLYVSIVGNGRLYDGEAIIKDQVNKYEIEPGTKKSFRIAPDAGHKLQKVTLDNVDITKTVKDDIVTIQGEDYEQHLTVYFEAAPKGRGSQNTINKGFGPTGVRTGDPSRLGISIAALLSFLLIFFLLIKKKNEETRA